MPPETRIERVGAASRSAEGVSYVCPIGWSSDVFHLHGAAGAVWQSLEVCRTIADVAAANGVAADDEFLVSSITMMLEAGLLREPT
jgi:hypothetical protein